MSHRSKHLESEARAPDLAGEPGWARLEVPAIYEPGRSYASGEPDGQRLRVRYYHRDGDDAMLGKVWFGPGTEGPPGHAHGGSICALMDEAMGGSAWMLGHPVVAARVTVNFRKIVPLGTVAWFRAWVEAVHGRKVTAKGVLTSAHATDTFADADGLFIVIKPEQVSAMDERMHRLFERSNELAARRRK
ncbi:MAG: PaaI family thioesterase [Deltaproteobacteria bacterium]|nr:PaaI family thioesterase [Deltaproteobacteria bacterium]